MYKRQTLATLAENPGFSRNQGEIRKETDCLLEEAGFEPPVPPGNSVAFTRPTRGAEADRMVAEPNISLEGTSSSNPALSSKESVANLTPDKATEASCA